MIRTDIDQTKLMEFMHQTLGDIASSASTILVIIGERLGLYKALAEADIPLASDELATHKGIVCPLSRSLHSLTRIVRSTYSEPSNL